MKLSYLPLIVALSLCNQPNPAVAQSEDPGQSGVIDGSDVRQFLDSGSRFNPTRMEEASRRFDKMIKMPPRLRRAKNWNEVIQRDEHLKIAPTNTQNQIQRVNTQSGASTSQSGLNIQAVPAGQLTTQQIQQQQKQQQQQQMPIQAQPAQNTNLSGTTNGQPQEKHSFIKKVGRGLEEAAEVVGFPISDEPLPNDVDASLAGDLPDGEDPRVYVHPKPSAQEAKARETLLEKAENRGASAEDLIPEGNNQPPALIIKE